LTYSESCKFLRRPPRKKQGPIRPTVTWTVQWNSSSPWRYSLVWRDRQDCVRASCTLVQQSMLQKHASLRYWKPRAHLTLLPQRLLSRTTRYS